MSGSIPVRSPAVPPVVVDDSCDRTRRQLLAVAGGGALGLLLGLHLTPTAGAEDSGATRPFDAWIRFDADGRVVLLVAKAEMGQGVLTSLPMLLAEELGVDLEQVEVHQAPVDPSAY
jgi:isoquinoline 1-oxidoreductase subunit beta